MTVLCKGIREIDEESVALFIGCILFGVDFNC